METILPRLAPTPTSYLVIATRGHRDDLKVLRWAIGTQARYVGMLGSQRKVVTLFRALTDEGADPAALERVRAPVGLDIGATTPEEIAISVVAELIAFRRGAAIVQEGGLQARRPRLATAAQAAPAKVAG